MNGNLISLMLALPFIGAVFQAATPEVRVLKLRGPVLSRWVALFTSLSSGLLGAILVASLDTETAGLQLSETVAWIGSYAIAYDLGLDGINAPLVLLISLVFPLLIGSEWDRKDGVRGIQGLLLLMQSALMGAVCSQDMFLMFFFWSLSALPIYFLIGIWGGENREKAAFRTVVSSSIGNALLFAAMVMIYYSVEPHTFSLRELSGGKLDGEVLETFGVSISLSKAAFFFIALGLAFRAPVWPLHGWFTQAAEQAPPSVLAVMAATVVPVATGIFLRLCYSLFPSTSSELSDGIVFAGALSLVVGGLCALAQRGLRQLMAFLTLSEVGLILMGIGSLTSAGVVGAVYHQLVLGIALAGFGLFIGVMVDRTGELDFKGPDGSRTMGGLSLQTPALAVIAAVIVASLLGIPGLGGFVGHSLLLVGSYELHPLAVLLAGSALLLATHYLFTMYRFVFFGAPHAVGVDASGLSKREQGTLLPVVFLLVFFGVYPKPLIELIRPSSSVLLGFIHGTSDAENGATKSVESPESASTAQQLPPAAEGVRAEDGAEKAAYPIGTPDAPSDSAKVDPNTGEAN
jgi:NADH-quinone oxidoreductase subunit M